MMTGWWRKRWAPMCGLRKKFESLTIVFASSWCAALRQTRKTKNHETPKDVLAETRGGDRKGRTATFGDNMMERYRRESSYREVAVILGSIDAATLTATSALV